MEIIVTKDDNGQPDKLWIGNREHILPSLVVILQRKKKKICHCELG